MRAAKPRATCVPVSLWHEVQGCRLHAHAAGEGPAVVLIHGLGVSSAYFLPLAERLTCHFCVYALDLPGHGRSATPPRALDVPELAQALLGWMQACGARARRARRAIDGLPGCARGGAAGA